MCRVLKVSESGYYRRNKRGSKPRARQLLLVEINNILSKHPDNDNYGIDRIQTALAQHGIKASRRTVYRAMEEGGLLHKRRRPHGLTKADTETQDRENLIKRDFTASAPLRKLLTDITEVPCSDGKLYVSPILDCFNGEIVALEMRDNMKKELCIDTVENLREKYGKALNGAVFHSDDFRAKISTCGMCQSLSGTAHCFDNARMESFFATLKKEKLYRIPTYRMTREQVKRVIFRYIFGYYNTLRVNSFNPDGLPPVVYRLSSIDSVRAA